MLSAICKDADFDFDDADEDEYDPVLGTALYILWILIKTYNNQKFL